MRAIFSAAEIDRAMSSAARAVRPSMRDLLRALAVQTENHASDLSKGPASAPPGDYPIPIRTGTHRRAFGFEVGDNFSVVFNSGRAARALHDGFRPYGNPHARPIPARPYFDDALKRLDLDAALAAFQARLEGGAP